jgi:hypothetical protein
MTLPDTEVNAHCHNIGNLHKTEWMSRDSSRFFPSEEGALMRLVWSDDLRCCFADLRKGWF